MQRDMELVRAILLAIEAVPGGDAPHPLVINGYTDAQIGYHPYLMNQAGLINAADASDYSTDGPTAIPMSMTWAGHEFLDAARDENIWRKTLAAVKSVAGGVGMAVLKDALAYEIRARLHLPQ